MSSSSRYREAGVDIDAQEEGLRRVKDLARSTFDERVLSDIGSFGGLFRPDLEGYTEPVLVASADGVGTKLSVARRVGDFSTVGIDLVNHCVNDILVQGARPLFFLDYVGAGVLDPGAMAELVTGLSRACRENGCVLLGGETAEMPGFYAAGDYELVGFVVGLVDRGSILDGSRVVAGDVLVGLPSSGLHTNGYSLARKVLFDELGLGVDDTIPGFAGLRVGDALMAPHRSYLRALEPVLFHPGLHALAHITGGGMSDNVPRILPRRHGAEVRVGCWDIPEIFYALEEHGKISTDEMFRVFNMGVGMIAVVAQEALREILGLLAGGEWKPFVMGSVQKGAEGVVYDLERRPLSSDDAELGGD